MMEGIMVYTHCTVISKYLLFHFSSFCEFCSLKSKYCIVYSYNIYFTVCTGNRYAVGFGKG